jgi:5-methyltetrahydrofolate--homocysteine methyltransferase
VREEFTPTLERLKAEAVADGWLKPRAVYGYFPTQSVGNELVVYEPEPYQRDGTLVQKTRFHFPRQEGRERLCIADYFRSSSSGDVDVVAFQIVTVGDEATRRFEALQAAGEYSEGLYSHGR